MPGFTTGMHHHRELELKCMVSGTDKAHIGDMLYAYGPGDLVLMGPHLPHFWSSDPHFEQSGTLADCYYLQFAEDFVGDEFLLKHDAQEIRDLFLRSRGGIRFLGAPSEYCSTALPDIMEAKGMDRFLKFIHLMHRLSQSTEYVY